MRRNAFADVVRREDMTQSRSRAPGSRWGRMIGFACLLTSLTFALGCGGGGGEGEQAPAPTVTEILPGQGVSIQQVDFFSPGGDQPNSTWGRLAVDAAVLEQQTGMRRGYVSVVNELGLAVANLPVPAPGQSRHVAYFDLGLDQPGPIDTTQLAVRHSDVALADIRPHLDQPVSFPVGRWISRAHGIGSWPDLELVSAPQDPPTIIALSTLPLPQLPTFSHLQTVTNVECALNQCYPMATANCLRYLEISGVIGLPNVHAMGIGVAGDPTANTLVGLLDAFSNRPVTSRTSGDGVWFAPMIEGTFTYLADAAIGGGLSYRHQDRGYTPQPLPAGDFTAVGLTSSDDGANATWGWIDARIVGGCGVLLVYVAHAVRITGSGRTLGQPWIRYSHDDEQGNDTAGLENVFTFLSDTDGDGLLNFGGSDREIRIVWAVCP